MRARPATLIAAPSMIGGVLAAHALAYRWTVPAAERSHELRQTGHAWLAYLPLLLAVLAALLVVGVTRRVLAPGGGRPAAWPFAVLPPLAFLLQENLERLLHDGSLQLAAGTPVLAGVLLAVPFGLAAYLVAGWLLEATDAVARALRPAPARLLSLRPTPMPLPLARPAGVPSGAAAGRGPPRAR